jgi:hypothetical protein
MERTLAVDPKCGMVRLKTTAQTTTMVSSDNSRTRGNPRRNLATWLGAATLRRVSADNEVAFDFTRARLLKPPVELRSTSTP